MDVISEAMERFIETFKSELVPASVQIVERLVRFVVSASAVILTNSLALF